MKKYWRLSFRVTLIIMVLMSIILVAPQNASAAKVKLISWNLVNKKKQLNWDGKTSYQKEFNFGVGVWNKYKKGVIRKKTAKVTADARLSDYSKKEPIVAVTSSRGTMKFNRYNMKKLTLNQRRNVMIHELGHALGLAHNTKEDVIFSYVTSRITLSGNDQASYNAAYRKY